MLKVIELFAGIGSQTQALKNIGIDHKVIGISEIDKFAIKSYEILHGKVNNFGDISKIDKLPEADLWTYSFPCQDLSVSGKQRGIKKGTRSGLLFEVERLLNSSTKPKYLLLENVKNLIGINHKDSFEDWCKTLEKLGYTNYYKVLNAINFGIPQTRERLFMVSILNDDKEFTFPEGKKTNKRIKDFLENNVDSKYFLKDELVKEFTRAYATGNVVGTIEHKGWIEQMKRVFGLNSYCQTLSTMQGGNRQPKILLEDGRIRKLTPVECWGLMGWNKEEIEKVREKISNSQMYKQAGNSIVIQVLEGIFKNLFKGS